MTSAFHPHQLVPFETRHEVGVVALIEECYGGYEQRIELDTLDADLLQITTVYPPPEHLFQVLETNDQRVIGTVAIKTDGKGSGELKRVFVAPDQRGRGFGKGMTLWAFDWARDHGCTELEFWSDVQYETAHGMYQHLGATKSGETRFLGGINEVSEYHFRVQL
ncbi:MAG: GNAT family N-acetyltransferase [Planctomycetota bacterium]